MPELQVRIDKALMPAHSRRGPLAVYGTAPTLDDGTLCRAESPKPMPVGTDLAIDNCDGLISSELRAACTLPDAPATNAYEKVQARKVLSWLRLNQASIVNAETTWTIDRRAVAGVIAWEALKNVKENRFYSRWSGPGKIHYFQYTRTSALEEVASLGYLKAGSKEQRRLAVQGIDGAVNAIGAIMRAFADVAAQLGGYCEFYWWPVLLVNFYNAWNISVTGRVKTSQAWSGQNQPP